jgi:hypothetical protein
LETKKDYEKDPGNWGFVGSLGHVNDLLEDVVEFLGQHDEETHEETNDKIEDTYQMSEYDKKVYK